MTRTFIIPGNPVHLARIAAFLNDSVCGILVHEHLEPRQVRGAVPALGASGPNFSDNLYTLHSLTRLTKQTLDPRDLPLYERCLHAILADPRAHYLATRSKLDSAFNNVILIEKILVNAILIVRHTRPTRLVSSSTPHSVEAWVFAKTVELMDIPVFVLERTAINNRAWIYRGLDTQHVVERPKQPNATLGEYSRSVVREQREAQAGARDKNGFLVSRMDLSSVKGSNANKWWSYRRELRMLFSGGLLGTPLRLLSVYMKKRLYESYARLAVEQLPSEPFVIFFMHYQPERSSLPEGLFHVQQWTAIRLLAASLPQGWKLLVREHPTTWLLPLDISCHTTTFFDDVAALPNVQVGSMELDTFELIDRCAACATLTGSVGFQAILRNRPVLAFGLPAYKDHPASYFIRSASDLAQAFHAIQSGAAQRLFSDEVLEKYLLWVEQNSICSDDRETDWLEARLKNFTALYREILSEGSEPALRRSAEA